MREHEREAQWIAVDGSTHEHLRLGWEAGGWTADGIISGIGVQYAIRLDADWRLRQFMLFRDMEDPDLWLASDGTGIWGEVNGAERPDLAGCRDLDLGCSPFTNTLPIRRLNLDIGQSADITVAWVDVDTLQVVPDRQRYARVGERRWAFESVDSGFAADLEVDDHGLVIDYPGLFVRFS